MDRTVASILGVAKELLAYGGQHVEVKSLPQGIQNALRHIPFNRRDIEVVEASSYSPGDGNTAFEGNRSFLLVVDIKTGRIEDSMQGSWGGENPFETKRIHTDTSSHPIASGNVVIRGESGGRGTFARIMVNPADKGLLVTEEAQTVDLTDDEKKALGIINSTKSGYRADEFGRQGIGDYSTNNPLIQSLEKKGLLKIMASGIRVTTSGVNAARGLRGW
jgi:hypothetical protein